MKGQDIYQGVWSTNRNLFYNLDILYSAFKGRLIHNHYESLILELQFSGLDDDDLRQFAEDSPTFDIIYGSCGTSIYTVDMITLSNCKLEDVDYSEDPVRFIYTADWAFFKDIASEAEARSNVCVALFDNLRDWMGVSGIKSTRFRLDPSSYDFRYDRPDDIKYSIDKGVDIHFHWSLDAFNNINRGGKFEISEILYVVFENKENALSFYEWIDYVKKFRQLISILLDVNCNIGDSLRIASDLQDFMDGDGQLIPLLVNDEDLNRAYSNKIYHRFSRHKFLFTYNDISNEFNSIIKKWYLEYDIFKDVFYTVIENIYMPDTFHSNHFLNVAQALERFHSLRYPDKYIFDKQKYNDTVTLMLQLLKDKLGDDLEPLMINKFKGLLNNGKGLSYQDRINELIDEINEDIPESISSKVIEAKSKIKANRNNYSHMLNDTGKLTGKELTGLYFIGRYILSWHIYRFLIENNNAVSEVMASDTALSRFRLR